MIRRDPIFKGCTRPAMLWGVPLTPLLVVMSALLLLAMWLHLLIALAMFPAFFAMKMIARKDDQQFRLLGLRLKCRAKNANGKFWKASAYSPVRFTARK